MEAVTKQMQAITKQYADILHQKQYFVHCATISSRIFTGSFWEDSQRNSSSNCLFRFILVALVLLKTCSGLSMSIQTDGGCHQTNAGHHQTICRHFTPKTVFCPLCNHFKPDFHGVFLGG